MTQEPLWQPSDIQNQEGVEKEADGDAPKRRGRIPQSAWPSILERYRAGATLSAIAREFDCTPSAISYIVRKAETAQPGEGDTAPAPAVEAAPAPKPARAPKAVAPAAPAPALPLEQPVVMEAPAAPQAPAAAVEAPPVAPTPVEAAPVAEQPPRPPRAAGERGPRGERPIRSHEGRSHEGRSQETRSYEGREGRPEREPRAERPEGEQPRGDRFGDRPQRGERRTLTGAAVANAAQERSQPPAVSQGQRPYGDRQGNRAPVDTDSMDQLLDRPYNSDRPVGSEYPYRQQQRNAARLEAAETPTEPADQRMIAAAQRSAEAYTAWKANPEGGMQGLTDALHELRKVIARMEIEMSASRKEEHAARPIPIPYHRAQRR
ncbi:hypothetical protein FBZ89_104124 [Nitrospirillum amazonense]|uniref:Uncharacterized protein n=1 Tax=Nitrospirillum amazonense TaxID=28077 RepID=A0A560FJV5_9PROT|nr:hypothetical protein [Nitrospirillum amazonense]TWB21876.1 hypothetical protein FBZ89_104124 [Nitrospirillum amazonense]